MMVIRLVVLAVLAWVAWVLLREIMGRVGIRGRAQPGIGKEHESKVQDVLVEDPVCHTLVPKKQAIRLRRDTITYYFCSEACCDKFTGKGKEEE